jgi:hypothetical protein
MRRAREEESRVRRGSRDDHDADSLEDDNLLNVRRSDAKERSKVFHSIIILWVGTAHKQEE